MGRLSSRLIGTLYPTPPYDFQQTLRIARYHTVLDIVEDGVYWRALRFGDVTALLQVINRGTVNQPALDVYLVAATGEVHPPAVLDAVAFLLHTDFDPTPFYAYAETEPALWSMVAPLRGLRHVRAASVYEALMTTVIEQQIALALAQRSERWLVEWGGNFIDHDHRRFYTFPRPEQIALAATADLMPLKITTRRMQVMIDLARQYQDGELDLEALRQLPPMEAHQKLTKLKGIGRWTAAWTLIRSQGHYHYMGSGDVALRAAVNRFFFGRPGRADAKVVDDLFGSYGEFAGAAAFYILMRYALERYP